MYIADCHLHTIYSDGSLEMRELIDLMGQQGFGAIAITDHLCEEKTFLGKTAKFLNKTLTKRTFSLYLEEIQEEAERAWKLYRMMVVPGVEITKNSFSHNNSAHIIALDIKKYINPDLPLNEVILEIHRQGGLAIAAHPVQTHKMEHQTFQLWNQRHELVDLMDAWEVASGRTIFKEVENSGLPMIANSDLHHIKQLESWKTVFHGEKHVGALKEAIIKQELEIQYFKPASSKLQQFIAEVLKKPALAY